MNMRRKDDTGIKNVKLRGFDDFNVSLGDKMRGVRATLGKSLNDVEKELKIGSKYIEAIENANLDVFSDAPEYIYGYVKSYAHYLNLDSDKIYREFCSESGIVIEHCFSDNMSISSNFRNSIRSVLTNKEFHQSKTPYLPDQGDFLSDLDFRALASMFVLAAMICGMGVGGWFVFKSVQKLHVTPVENTPDALTSVSPLDSGTSPTRLHDGDPVDNVDLAYLNQHDPKINLYRNKTLEYPIVESRDPPIVSIDPDRNTTNYSIVQEVEESNMPETSLASSELPDNETAPEISLPRVMAELPPLVSIVAVRPSWVRVRTNEGSVIFEGIMNGGETWETPRTEKMPTVRIGDSGSVYFRVNEKHYGPVGKRGMVTASVVLDAETVVGEYPLANIENDRDLMRYEATLASGNGISSDESQHGN